MTSLSPKQSAVLEFCLQKAGEGVDPTANMIAENVEISSSGIHATLKRLDELGFIERVFLSTKKMLIKVLKHENGKPFVPKLQINPRVTAAPVISKPRIVASRPPQIYAAENVDVSDEILNPYVPARNPLGQSPLRSSMEYGAMHE